VDIIVEERSNFVILKLNGNLIEGPESHEFNEIIAKYLKVNKINFIIDFADIKYINSTGLSIIFRAYLAIAKANGKFKIANLNSKLNNLLSITKLNTLFEIEKDIDSAILSLSD
jgi:anti-sigma B factor antagonist